MSKMIFFAKLSLTQSDNTSLKIKNIIFFVKINSLKISFKVFIKSELKVGVIYVREGKHFIDVSLDATSPKKLCHFYYINMIA